MPKRISEEARSFKPLNDASLRSTEIVLGILKRIMQRKRWCGGDDLAVLERKPRGRPRKPVDKLPGEV